MSLQELSYLLMAIAIVMFVGTIIALILRRLGVKRAISGSVILTGLLILCFFAVIYFKMLGTI